MSATQPVKTAINKPSDSTRAHALWLAFANQGAENVTTQVTATLAAAKRGDISFDGLYEARRGGRMVGAIWGYLMPGKTAVIWPPHLTPGTQAAIGDKLWRHLEDYLRGNSVRLVQSALNKEYQLGAEWLSGHGFERAAELHYLFADCSGPPNELPDGKLRFEAYSNDGQQRLAGLVEQTYRDSLDFPILSGVRDLADIIDGYRSTGSSDSNYWYFARHDGDDIGCLLLADHPEDDQVELVYMGLIPSIRGHQFGAQLVRKALLQTRALGRSRMVLGVDSANTPAIAAYEEAGLVAWGQRTIYLKNYAG